MGTKQKRRIDRLTRMAAHAKAGRDHGLQIVFDSGVELGRAMKRINDLKRKLDERDRTIADLKSHNSQRQVDRVEPDPIILDGSSFSRVIVTLPVGRQPRGMRISMAIDNQPRRPLDIPETAVVSFESERVIVPVGREKREYYGWRMPDGVILVNFGDFERAGS